MHRLAVFAVMLAMGLALADDHPGPHPGPHPGSHPGSHPGPHPGPPKAPLDHNEEPGVFRPPGFPYVAPYLPYHHFGYGYYPYLYHPTPYGGVPYPHHLPYHPAPVVPGPHSMTFRGKFSGTCKGQKDGLYYVDVRSFAFCSGETKTIQPCAEGTRNPTYEDFESGKFHYFYDFCSVHLQAAESHH